MTPTQGPALATGIDRRIWWMIMAIGLFAVLIMREVALPSSVMAVFGGLALLGLFMVGVQQPELPLYALIAYLPFSRILVGDFGTYATAFNLTNILILWTLVAHAFRQAGRGQPLFQGTPLNRVILLFSALGTISLLIAGWSYGSWYAWEYLIPLKRWLTPMFLYFLTLWVVRDVRAIKTVAALIMVVVTVVALMAIRDYASVANSSFEDSRVGGIAEHSNTLGAFFVYYMFLLLGFFLAYPSKLKAWWLLIPFALCFRGIMVTFSRGAYLACAVGALAACWFRSKILFVVAVAVGLFALANPVVLPAGIRYRLGQTVQGGEYALQQDDLAQNLESSAASRIVIWRGAWQMIREHPWRGVGYGAFPRFIPHYTVGRIGEMDAHNSYLLIAAEMGLPTLAVFLLVLVMVWHYTCWLYRHAQDPALRAIALGFLAGLAGLVVANLFGSRMDAQEVTGYFWVLCGLVMRGVLMERQARREARRA
ncbi:MAG: O-antigen ligase family protein [Candidatus Omnitrophica bacterium]|nr:O-antigen ligase family protein [Candidatus Omnitrophota bacterium]